jgi:hypothetical protein
MSSSVLCVVIYFPGTQFWKFRKDSKLRDTAKYGVSQKLCFYLRMYVRMYVYIYMYI